MILLGLLNETGEPLSDKQDEKKANSIMTPNEEQQTTKGQHKITLKEISYQNSWSDSNVTSNKILIYHK